MIDRSFQRAQAAYERAEPEYVTVCETCGGDSYPRFKSASRDERQNRMTYTFEEFKAVPLADRRAMRFTHTPCAECRKVMPNEDFAYGHDCEAES